VIAPVPVQDIHAGREAFARDLQAVLKGLSLTERGWAMPNDITLLVPVFALHPLGHYDAYMLELVFDHYASGPPLAQFVNPQTLTYRHPEDVVWVPRCEGHPSIAFHPNYNNGRQLICTSTNLEFYKINHDVAEQHIWRPGQMNFMSTLAAIKANMTQPYYKGRYISP
jgi:hypothetical protein